MREIVLRCSVACINFPAPQRDVAQPGRAPALGAGCRQFESGRPDHLKNLPSREVFYYAGGQFELFRAAKRSTAKFCGTQNNHPIREAVTAGTERSVVNLAPLVRRTWIPLGGFRETSIWPSRLWDGHG